MEKIIYELLGNVIERMMSGLLKINVRVCLLFLHHGRPPKEEEGVDFQVFDKWVEKVTIVV